MKPCQGRKATKTKLRLLLRDAVTRLRETDEDSYFYSYYVELCRFYTPLTEEKLSSDMVRGWNEFFSQDITTVLIAIAVASTLCTAFTCDSDAGRSGIQPHGKIRRKTSAACKALVCCSGFRCDNPCVHSNSAHSVFAILRTVFPLRACAVGGCSCALPVQSHHRGIPLRLPCSSGAVLRNIQPDWRGFSSVFRQLPPRSRDMRRHSCNRCAHIGN